MKKPIACENFYKIEELIAHLEQSITDRGNLLRLAECELEEPAQLNHSQLSTLVNMLILEQSFSQQKIQQLKSSYFAYIDSTAQ